jgi:hypothetical protein
VAGLVLVGSASVVALRGQDSDHAVAAQQGDTRQQVVTFYQQARSSLSPLIIHTLELPQALREIAFPKVAGAAPSADLSATAGSWTDDFATARDLVGRLSAPSQVCAQAQSLYESAAMLEVEAARVLVEAATSSDSRARQDAARAGYRYHLVSERLFDSAYRLLNQQGDLRDGKLYFPAAVPDFRAAGLDPDKPAKTLGPQAEIERPVPTVPAEQWFSPQNPVLAGALHVYAATAASYGSAAPQQAATAAKLTKLAAELGGSVPATTPAREGSVATRLSLVVLGESLRPQTGNGEAPRAAARLRMIAERLWSAGLAAASEEIPASSQAALSPAKAALDEGLLRRGGLFNGSPPPLAPGQDPATGVPGGLPHLDPARILQGHG